MKPSRCVVFAALVLLPVVARAEEGMWMPRQIPALAAQLRAMGFTGDPESFADLTGQPMGAVVSLGGCTASFVSPDGLIVTNHHCVVGGLQFNSTPERNLLRDGFLAPTREAELSDGPGSRVFVTTAVTDVTKAITGGIDAKVSDRERYDIIDRRVKERVATCEADGSRCRVASFFEGREYFEIRQLEIRDVRLVYAPAEGIGLFGGDTDNWRWPRHTGDWSFLRAYVGRDGRPAAYSTDNVPYRPKQWLKFADKPLAAGDFVMVAGYPGSTNRYALADEFEQTVDWTYPTLSRHYKAMVALVDAEGRKNPDVAVKYASIVRSWENVLKNYDGQLEGFERMGAIATKRKQEEAVEMFLRKRGRNGEGPLQAYQTLRALHTQASATRERDQVLGQLGRNGVLATAVQLYRLSIERARPDADREPGFQQRDYARIEGELRQMERRYVPAMDRELTRYWLQQYLRLPKEQRLKPLDAWLKGGDDKAIASALKALAATRLGSTEERLRWMKADRKAFETSKDPAIRYAVAMMPTLLQVEEARKARAGDNLVARPHYLQAVADYKKSRGEAVYPDANGSLRITFGTVTGYTTRDGARQKPFTLLEEVAAKATGQEPFDAPPALLEAIRAKRYGGLADKKLGTVPVDFLSDLDITGGNSGSPVLNAEGKLVGLAFDGNWESVSSNWIYDGSVNRMISVDQRYMRWIMQEVFPAPQLLQEMGVPAKK